MSFYNSDGSDNENQEEEQEGQLTPVQQKMKAILLKKGTIIVDKLLDHLSPRNQDDLESTLNASTILLDFCENDYCFNLLTSPEAMRKLIHVCCQGDHNQQNLPYALNLLTQIIMQYSDTEKEITEERKQQIQ